LQSKVSSVRFDARLSTLLEARIIRISHARNYEYYFGFLVAIKDEIACDIFLRDDVVDSEVTTRIK